MDMTADQTLAQDLLKDLREAQAKLDAARAEAASLKVLLALRTHQHDQAWQEGQRLAAALALHRPSDDLMSSALLRELLVEKRQHAIERVFRALGILHPRDDLRSLHDALVGDDGVHRDAAREILEHLLPVDERAPLLALIDDAAVSDDELRAQHPTYTDVMAALLADPSDSLRCVAAHHVAERQLLGLVGELVRLQPLTGSRLVTEAFQQAIARLRA